MILEEYLEIIPSGANYKFYQDLGYQVEKHKPIKIKNEDVQKGSGKEEKLECDICGEIYTRKHGEAVKYREKYGKDICLSCVKKMNIEKSKKAIKNKYGVDFPMQNKEIKDKSINTTLERYGVKYTLENKQIRDKAIDSFMKSVDGEKIKNMNKKKRETCLARYGVEYPMQNEEIASKATRTLNENNRVPTSKQQLQLFELCKNWFPDYLVELNYPLSSLSLDIKITTLDGILIDLEYDGQYWHQDGKRDFARDCVVKKYGYKIIRVRTRTSLPTKEQLKEAVEYVSQENHTFSQIKLSDWKEEND